MKAMRLLARGAPLATCEVRLPPPEGEQLLIGVEACGVCRTDLHLVDDELPGIGTPITPGHEIVGTVLAAGTAARFRIGDRVGVPWLAWTCGVCEYCRGGRENLCPRRASPATQPMAATRSRCSPRRATACRCRPRCRRPSWRRFCAPVSSATGPTVRPAGRRGSACMASERPRT